MALGVIFLLLILFCCGGVFLVWSSFKLTKDRAAVEAATAQITDIDVPQVLQPAAAMNLRVPVVNKTFMRFAVYGDKHADQESYLLVFSLGEAIAEPESGEDTRVYRAGAGAAGRPSRQARGIARPEGGAR